MSLSTQPPSSSAMQIDRYLFPTHRAIEKCYMSLPWPQEIRQIAVVTYAPSGYGDISAAAKVISVMQRICPELIFDWVLILANTNKVSIEEAMDFLADVDKTKVFVRYSSNPSHCKGSVDLLLSGPAKSWDTIELQDRIKRTVEGVRFDFLEIAETPYALNLSEARSSAIKTLSFGLTIDYVRIHRELFPYKNTSSIGSFGKGSALPMGLLDGTGVLLDADRIKAPLSRKYCCPSYLYNIENKSLRGDIFSAMKVDTANKISRPDYNRYSFNFGYARRRNSWKKFIDCVVIHEREKEVVIVFNYKEKGYATGAQNLFEGLFPERRLSFLETKGYGKITLKIEEEEVIRLLEGAKKPFKTLTVIGRQWFSPQDMKWLQLAAERLLATGDNSAVEAWCSRCKLYVYEDIGELFGCKWLFLQQQVDFAITISPALSQLLALFGSDKRYDDGRLNKQFNNTQIEHLKVLLSDAGLEEATFQFCQSIVRNYSFEKALEGAIKRCVWNYLLPALQKAEAESLDSSFCDSCISILTDTLKIHGFPAKPSLQLLAERVKQSVEEHLNQAM